MTISAPAPDYPPRSAHRGRLMAAATGAALAVSVLVGVATTNTAAAAGPGPLKPPVAGTQKAVDECPRVPGRISCLAQRLPVAPGRIASGSQPSSSAAPTGYGPADLRAAYRIPATATKATIAIVDAYGAATVAADLAVYRAEYGLGACTAASGCLTIVNQSGASGPLPAEDSGWAGETALDVQMVSAVCPSCRILLVQTDDNTFTSMTGGVRRAVAMGAQYVSMSWGGSESVGELSDDAATFSTRGVVYAAASGDDNYRTGWPAASPNVVSVGGTSLIRDRSTARGFSERVWGMSNGYGTGSGCSRFESPPAWQAIEPIKSLCPGGRATNDVSVVGDPDTGVSVYLRGQWAQFGGTSAGAPMIAAMYALAGTPSATPAPSYPYAHRDALFDVTDGANATCGNLLCEGAAGWDGPSGLGTPNGVTAFAASPLSFANPGLIATKTGTAVSIRVTASDSAGLTVSYTAAGLPPGVTMRADGYLVGAAGHSGSFLVTVTGRDELAATGIVKFRWNVTNHVIVPSPLPRVAGTVAANRVISVSSVTFRSDSAQGAVIRPSVRVQWYLDGRALTAATQSTLRISPAWRHHVLTFQLCAGATWYANYAYVARAVRVP
jgi:hypothetical protein